MKEEKAYSAILQDFIEPIVTRDDTEDSYFDKCFMGHFVWNYCVCLEYGRSEAEIVLEAIHEKYFQTAQSKAVVAMLMERWKRCFKQYDRFIFRIESRDRHGMTTLYCESIQANKMDELKKLRF